MQKVKFVVRVLRDDQLVAGYVRDLTLPFVPFVGMRFEQGVSTALWETSETELCPSVESVVFDLDEETVV